MLEDDRPIDLPAVRREARELLAAVYPEGHCGDFTQALMELGATVCVPNGAPQCIRCPLADLCRARATDRWQALPTRLPKRKRRQEDWTVFILDCGGRFALEQRGPAGLLAGLWQFPNVPGKLEVQEALDQAAQWGTGPTDFQRSADRNHIFTHIQWNLRCCRIACQRPVPAFQWMTAEEIREQVPLPTAFRQFMDFYYRTPNTAWETLWRNVSSMRCLMQGPEQDQGDTSLQTSIHAEKWEYRSSSGMVSSTALLALPQAGNTV